MEINSLSDNVAARRGGYLSPKINGLGRPTPVSALIENVDENPILSNEKPGALAGATGLTSIDLAIKAKAYRKPKRSAMSAYALDRHKRASRALGYALTAADPATWEAAGHVFAHRLNTIELASLAFHALRAMEPAEREAVFDAAQWGIA